MPTPAPRRGPTARASERTLRIGMIADLHYADKPPAGSRHYRESLEKFDDAAMRFTAEGIDFLVELGDLIDAADSVDVERAYLRTINKKLIATSKQRHYVLGNHCVATLTKDEFLAAVNQRRSFYSFDHGEFHFVVLDACFRGDGAPYERNNFEWIDANIPTAELGWLRQDLTEAARPTIVFAHQRLDVSNDYGVNNAATVRATLESAGHVRVVFQGHSHENDYRLVGGIHYCTLAAMVEGSGRENNGFSVLELSPGGNMAVRGFGRQEDYCWKA